MASVTDNSMQLQSLIDAINELPNASDSSGGSSEENLNTCEIVIVEKYGYAMDLSFVCKGVYSGEVVYIMSHADGTASTRTVSNVQCDSLMFILCSGTYNATCTDGEVVHVSGSGIVYKTPSAAGVSPTVTIEME